MEKKFIKNPIENMTLGTVEKAANQLEGNRFKGLRGTF